MACRIPSAGNNGTASASPAGHDGVEKLPLHDALGCKYPTHLPPVGSWYMRELRSVPIAGKQATPHNWIPDLPIDRARIFCQNCSRQHDPALCRAPVMVTQGGQRRGDLPNHCGICGAMHRVDLCLYVRRKINIPGVGKMDAYVYALWFARQGLWPFQTSIDLSKNRLYLEDPWVLEVNPIGKGKNRALNFSRYFGAKDRILKFDYTEEQKPGGITRACRDPTSDRFSRNQKKEIKGPSDRFSRHQTAQIKGPPKTTAQWWNPNDECLNWREEMNWGPDRPLPTFASREWPILTDEHGFVTAVWKPGSSTQVHPIHQPCQTQEKPNFESSSDDEAVESRPNFESSSDDEAVESRPKFESSSDDEAVESRPKFESDSDDEAVESRPKFESDSDDEAVDRTLKAILTMELGSEAAEPHRIAYCHESHGGSSR
ncbi:hypothetical protein F4860DRAFT_510857 [Xylaria cubensis]|nr:hypothetical protein F4860DRAFT_510857 [Xylaria cubensis]